MDVQIQNDEIRSYQKQRNQTDLRVMSNKTIKLLEENITTNFCELKLSRVFYNTKSTNKQQQQK